MPFTAVSAAWAASAGISPSASSGRPPLAIAAATARNVRILGADSPHDLSVASSAAAIVDGVKSPRRAISRFQIASALVTENCWPMTIQARP